MSFSIFATMSIHDQFSFLGWRKTILTYTFCTDQSNRFLSQHIYLLSNCMSLHHEYCPQKGSLKVITILNKNLIDNIWNSKGKSLVVFVNDGGSSENIRTSKLRYWDLVLLCRLNNEHHSNKPVSSISYLRSAQYLDGSLVIVLQDFSTSWTSRDAVTPSPRYTKQLPGETRPPHTSSSPSLAPKTVQFSPNSLLRFSSRSRSYRSHKPAST